jgi:hypothetical protein
LPGPVEYVVIEFPGNQFKGEVVPALKELVRNGTISIIDLIFIRKDQAGSVESLELAELTSDEAGQYESLPASIGGLLNEEDVRDVAAGMANNSSVALLVWEDAWATRFADAVRNANGRVTAHERVPREVVEAAMAAAQA